MARVPSVQGRQVREQALQGGFNNTAPVAGAFEGNSRLAGQVAQSMDQAGDAANRIAQRQVQEEAFRVETAIKTDFMEFENNLRRSRRGAGAAGYANEVDAWWEKAKADYGKELTPAGRRLAQTSLSTARMQSVNGAMQYQAREIDRAEKESYNASQVVEIQRAANSGDPNVAASARELMNRRVFQHAATNNWTADQVDEEILRWNTQLHTRMIGALMDADPEAARMYFDDPTHKEEIEASMHPKIEAALKDAESTQEARLFVNGISGKSETEQLEAVRDIADDKTREKARQFVRQDMADMAAATSASQKAASDDIWHRVSAGAKGLNELPPSVLTQMSGKGRKEVVDYFRRKAEADAAVARGEGVKTDPVLRSRMERMIAQEPQKFVALGPLEDVPWLQGVLSGADLIRFNALQTTLARPKASATPQQVLSSFLDSRELPTGKDNAEARGQVTLAYYSALADFVEHESRDPNNRESEGILAALMLSGKIPRSLWFAKEVFAFEVKDDPEQLERLIRHSEISGAERQRVVTKLRERGISAPTEDQIRLQYYSNSPLRHWAPGAFGDNSSDKGAID